MLVKLCLFLVAIVLESIGVYCGKNKRNPYGGSERSGRMVVGPGFGNLFLEGVEFVAQGVEGLAGLCCAKENEVVVWDLCHLCLLCVCRWLLIDVVLDKG